MDLFKKNLILSSAIMGIILFFVNSGCTTFRSNNSLSPNYQSMQSSNKRSILRKNKKVKPLPPVSSPQPMPQRTEPVTVPGLSYGNSPRQILQILGEPDRLFDFGNGQRWYYDRKDIQIVIYQDKLIQIVRAVR